MFQYCYFPILKTRQSEFSAYDLLNENVKNSILPIIELTGALGYTYPKNYKVESLRKKHRPGNIETKINKILDLIGNRRFILDITDDESLMYDGLSDRDGGLLDHSNGYQAWLTFLKKDKNFKQQVIPTIQFNTLYRSDVELQIKELNADFDYIAIKLPAFLAKQDLFDSEICFNSNIQRIIDWILSYIPNEKLILVLDFGYIKDFNTYKTLINKGLKDIRDLSGIKAIIPTSSSYPNFVVNVPKPIIMSENFIFDFIKDKLGYSNIYHGDYASLHPTKYEMGGGGWIPRIDYIVRNEAKRPIKYDYVRGTKRNTSSEYFSLAKKVVSSSNYNPISDFLVDGDMKIKQKAENGIEGKAPAYWIAVRSNIYMTAQFLYFKEQGSFLAL